ncbi:MAG: GntR family transcriptional regulator [Acidobacteria bacterium]|nr:GntR family transcriptional regulator [Acidobacteriota bacterium]
MQGQGATFGEIAAESLRDKVVAALKEAFFARRLRPGDPIVERRLANEMHVGTPAIREALVTLQEQGFVQRIANTATYVRKFTIDEVDQLYQLRIEFESLAFRWAKLRVVEADLQTLEQAVELMVEAATQGKAREFYERDLEFHRRCWSLCGNSFLFQSLDRLVTPLFAFVLNASESTVRVNIAREHFTLVHALRHLEDPEFSAAVHGALSGFARSGMQSMIQQEEAGEAG